MIVPISSKGICTNVPRKAGLPRDRAKSSPTIFGNSPSILTKEIAASTIPINMTEDDPYVYGVDEDEDRIQYRLEGEELKYVRELVKCLCVERAEEYDDWLRCGLLLHNINESLLDSWKGFSSQASNYSEPSCDSKWKSFDNGYSGPKLGLGSLKIWAQKDNPLKNMK